MPTSTPKELTIQEVTELLQTKYAIFTGGHDREFRSLIIFPDYQMDPISDESFSLLMQYLSTMNSLHASVHSFVIVIDRRAGDWNSIKTIIGKLNATFPATLEHIYVIKPQGFFQRFFVEKTIAWIRESSRYPITFVGSIQDLFPFIEGTHLPIDMGGQLAFDMNTWLQDRAVVQQILERCFHGFSSGSVPLEFERFRHEVTSLCDRVRELLDHLCRAASPLEDNVLRVYQVNPSYSPSIMTRWKRRRRKLLDTISHCELHGLQLRQTLRSRPGPVQTDQPGQNATTWAHVDGNFDLPVDRVFHVINLEHILVTLSESRSNFARAWHQFTKRAGIVKLMADIEQRFIELEPLVGVWENLLESASDYYHSGRASGNRLQAANMSLRKPPHISPDSLPRRASVDDSPTGVTVDPVESTAYEMCLEDLQAIVERLTEAEQFGTGLVPDLLALSKTATSLIAYVEKNNPNSELEIPGIEALTRFSFRLDSDSEPEEQNSPSVSSASSSLIDQSFPPLCLPDNADRWVPMIERLLVLAQSKLPATADQLRRIAQLYSEMDKARSWIRRGTELITAIGQTDGFASWSVDECRARLAELTTFYGSREEGNLHALTDPKLFHSRFAGIVTAELRNTLMELLRQMEEVEAQCQTGLASLRQHISRTSFPRHQSGSQSLSSTGTATSDSTSISPNSTSPNVRETRKTAPNQPRSSPTRTATNGFVRSRSSDAVASPVNRFRLAWEELLETERSYVAFLQSVYDIVWLQSDYRADSGSGDSSITNLPPTATTRPSTYDSPPPPTFMRENQGWLLVNWPELLCFHRDFLLPTLECANTRGIKLNQWANQVAPRMIDLYSVYCSLHDNAVHVAVQLERDRIYSGWMNTCNEQVYRREQATVQSQSRQTIESSDTVRPVLRFSSRLVTPVQRFQRYHLLIERLLRLGLTETDKQDLSEAHQTMLRVCETVNLTMRLRGLSIRPSELGWLLLRGDFAVSRDDTRAMSNQQRHVFLFTNAILLTKFRSSATSGTHMLTPSMPPLGSDFTVDGKERTGSNSSLPGSSSHPLVSNLANLAKTHILSGSNSPTPAGSSGSSDSGPVYEVRQELLMAQIGLTPSVRADRRRFAIWTANRAQTYIFHATESSTRDRWVHSINDLLMDQLRRLRDEALQRHGSVAAPKTDRKQRIVNQADRSCSLPSSVSLHFSKDPSGTTSILPPPAISGQGIKSEHRSQPSNVRKKNR